MLKSFFSSLIGGGRGSGNVPHNSSSQDTQPPSKGDARKKVEHNINYDPEDENFPELQKMSPSSSDDDGVENDDVLNDGKEKMHYNGMTANKNSHKQNFLSNVEKQSKYSGTKSSRKELGLDLEIMSKRPSLALNFSDDDDDETISSDVTFSSDEETNMSSSSMFSRIKKNLTEQKEEEEENEIMLISQRQEEEIGKGKIVRRELEEYQDLISLRIDLQPLIQLSNSIPYPPIKSSLPLALLDANYKNSVGKSIKKSMEICEEFLRIFENKTSKSPALKISYKSHEFVEDLLERIDSQMNDEWKTSLDEWHQKVHLSDSLSSNKMKIINQGIFAQLEMATRDMSRLLKRTNLQRPSSLKRSLPEAFYADVEHFDDQDFYNILCRDWIDGKCQSSNGANSTSNHYSIKKFGANPANTSDVKASKGRKIRYDAHAKLVNYMIPRTSPLEWEESKINSLFSSIFPTSFSI